MIKEGFYEDGIFRFIIEFSEKFPKELPTVTFKSRVYHPLISADGLLDLKWLFPNWTYEAGKQLIDILTRVRSIFSEKRFFEATDSYNPEAGKCFRETPEAFLQHSIDCAKTAKTDFMNLPEDCPYRFGKVEKIPDDVKMILENNSVG